MEIKRIKVNDRVRLTVIETDKFKTNYLSLNFLTPLDPVRTAENALLPQVLCRGTKDYPDMTTLNRRLDELYAAEISPFVSKIGEIQLFGFSADMLNDRYTDGTDVLDGTLGILRGLLFDPYTEDGRLSSAYTESEKRNLADAVRAQINNKNKYAVQRCREVMCEGERYALPETGSVAEIEAANAVSLTERLHGVFDKSAIELFFVGSTDTDALADRVGKILLPAEYAERPVLSTEVRRSAASVREFTEDQPVAQGKLSIGFRTGSVLSDGDYAAFMLFCELYGGSPNSRLFMNVREKLSLCYYCHAIPDAHKGIMIVTAGVEVENKQRAQDEILFQLERIRQGDFNSDDLDDARRSLINGYREISDSPSSLKRWYLSRSLAGRSDSPEDAARSLYEVTAEQVAAAAAKITLDTVYFMRGTLKSEDGREEAEDNDN